MAKLANSQESTFFLNMLLPEKFVDSQSSLLKRELPKRVPRDIGNCQMLTIFNYAPFKGFANLPIISAGG